jgi:large subunit ribosomal protein L6
MSKIGINPIKIEDGVTVKIEKDTVVVNGPLGEIVVNYPESIKIVDEAGEIIVSRKNETKPAKSMHGTVRMLVANAVLGVKNGYTRKLEIHGVGYRVAQEGVNISLSLGLNHAIKVEPIEGTELVVEDETTILVKGFDKQKVGEMAAKIRELKKPEPYKGKGIRYEDEYVRRKSAKVATA